MSLSNKGGNWFYNCLCPEELLAGETGMDITNDIDPQIVEEDTSCSELCQEGCSEGRCVFPNAAVIAGPRACREGLHV